MELTKEQNQALCEKYPFLNPVRDEKMPLSSEGIKDWDYRFTELDNMPDGSINTISYRSRKSTGRSAGMTAATPAQDMAFWKSMNGLAHGLVSAAENRRRRSHVDGSLHTATPAARKALPSLSTVIIGEHLLTLFYKEDYWGNKLNEESAESINTDSARRDTSHFLSL